MTKLERKNLWTARVAEFRASGQSVPAWCAVQELKPNQLRYWLKKCNEDTSANAMISTGNWLPLNINEFEPRVSSLTIRIGQALVEVRPGFDPALFLDVVKTLMVAHAE